MSAEQQRILVVDDEEDLRELLVISLGRMKMQAHAVGTVAEARQALQQREFDLCLTDMQLPDGDGLELVRLISQQWPELPVAMITAFGSMDTAIQAMKHGAYDYITKPVSMDQLRRLVDDGLHIRSAQASGPAPGAELVGEAPAMRDLKQQIAKLARSQAPIYISGESGSGKEKVAQLIHSSGPRHDKPFIAVNCGAIPSELMESEFFGHRKGSFTGAFEDRKGLFREADGGTLFLDEVADLPLHMQVKLLRAIQEKSVRPVGEAREFDVNVRIMCATHKNLAEQVNDGYFRQDLYYRLNVIEARVPPLRERREDIPLLVDFFSQRLSQQWGLPAPQFSRAARQALEDYEFPGNVRELENVLERALTLSDGPQIEPHHLQLRAAAERLPTSEPLMAEPPRSSSQPLEDYLQDIEKREILKALDATLWNRTAAARKLGMTFRSLRYRLKKLGLDQGGDSEDDNA